MEKISDGKQCEAKDSTPEIEIMTEAVLQPPVHPRKKVKCFAEMTDHDYRQTSSTDHL
jgi:hypothetical protein